MDSLEAWLEFRRNENYQPPPLVCCECGGRAEGNITCDDGEICDKCHAELVGGEA
jgi:hypothetical protein